jgi:undecaprenyl-diphosphatase
LIDTLVENIDALMAAHTGAALALVFAFAALEATFLVGMVVPGFVVLVAAGALVGAGKLPVVEVMAAAAGGAFTGTIASYALGRALSGRLRSIRPFAGYGALVLRGEDFFRRYGAASVFLGHFVPGVKAVVPAVAGMLGMGVVRFTLVAAAAAVASASAIIVPAIGLGMGLGGLAAADPRLLLVVVVAGLVAFLAWRTARMLAGRLLPAVLSWARRWSSRAVARDYPGARFVDAVLHDRGGILAPILWAGIGAVAVFGFVRVTLDVTLGSRMAVADQALSNFVQGFRSPPVDAVMLAVTMIGDGIVLTAVTLALIAVLAAAKEWRMAGAAVATVGAAALSVPSIKGLLERSRPIEVFEGNHAFSFPSGHASLTMAVIGVLAVVVARVAPPRWSLAIHGAAAAVASLVAFSRVYLAAHWPSDVVAGLLFGGFVVSAFALAVSRRRPAVHPAALAGVVGLAFLATYAVHARVNWTTATAAYARVEIAVRLDGADWVEDGWRRLPARRVELGGETGEPLSIQTDLPAGTVGAALAAAGWTVPEPVPTGLLSALPASAPLHGRGALPLFHDGRAPVLVALGPPSGESRPVVRLWPSGWETGPGRPILVGSVIREHLSRAVIGLSFVADDPADPAALSAARAAIGTPPGSRRVEPEGPRGPLLLAAAPPVSPD